MAMKRKGNQFVQVVLLKHIVKRFENARKAVANAGFGLLGKKWRYFSLEYEQKRQYGYRSSCVMSAIPSDVPKGHFAVYVGCERNRFIIPTIYLNHYIFQALLEKTEQEFGFDHPMGLTIPCQQFVFEYLISLMRKKHIPSFSNLRMDDLLD